jgi:excisionase family DNA binding protein
MSEDDLQTYLDTVRHQLDTMISLLEAMTDGADVVRLLSRKQAAARLGISVRKLDALEEAGDFQAIRIGRSVRYHPDTLQRFVRRRANGR